MTKAEISPRREELLPRLVMDPDITQTRAQMFDKAGPEEVFKVLAERERLHGFVGKISNRAKGKESGCFLCMYIKIDILQAAHLI